MKRLYVCAMMLASGFGTAQTTAGSSTPTTATPPLPVTVETKEQELSRLRAQSSDVMVKVGELARDGKIGASDDGVRLMQELVDQLKQINERLKALEAEIAEMKKANPSRTPQANANLDNLAKIRTESFMQLQYRSSNRAGVDNSQIQARRTRLGLRYQIDPRFAFRFSADFSQTATAQVATLQNAVLLYDVPMTPGQASQIRFGQFFMPFGSNLSRSIAEQEFAERTLYNQRLFAGARGQGVTATYSPTKELTVEGAIMNSLTISDPEQINVATNAAGRKPAYIGSVRYRTPNAEASVTAMMGVRPGFNATDSNNVRFRLPDVRRDAVVFDAGLFGVGDPRFFARAEYLIARDRRNLGNYANSGADFRSGRQTGYMAHIGWNFDRRNQINLRHEGYDASRAPGDVNQAWSLAYQYFANPNLRFQVTYDAIREPSTRYRQITIRSIIRF